MMKLKTEHFKSASITLELNIMEAVLMKLVATVLVTITQGILSQTRL